MVPPLSFLPRACRRGLLFCLLGAPLWVRAADGPAAAPPPVPALVVVAEDNYPPYAFRTRDGQLQGYSVDSWRLWSSKTGIPVDLRAMDWARAQEALGLGQAQVLDSLFRTPERETWLSFTQPFASIPVRLYVDSEIAGVNELEDLRGLAIGVEEGDACIETLRAAGLTLLQRHPNYPALIAAAGSGLVRAFCMDGPPADFLLYQAGLQTRFRAALTLGDNPVHHAVLKGDMATLAQVEQGFAAFTDAERDELRRHWLGHASAPLPGWERYLGMLAALAAAIGLAVLVWGMALRRMVEQRTAELHEQRQRLQSLISTLPDQVFVKDLAGIYLTCNPAFAARFARRPGDIVGLSDAELMGAAEAARVRQRDREALQGSERIVSEDLVDPADAPARLFETIRTPLRDPQGRLIGVLGIARDVTPYRENEDRLNRLNRLYRVLARVQEGAALQREPAGLFQIVCDALVGEGGLTGAWVAMPEAAGPRLLPLAQAGHLAPPARLTEHGDAAPRPEALAWQRDALVREPGEGPDSTVVLPLRAGNQRRALLAVRGPHLGAEEQALLERLAGQVGLALAAAEAETTRRVAVAALQDSEMRFAQMFQTSPVGLLLCRTGDGHVVDVNTAWLELFGHRLDEVVGQTVESLGLAPEPGGPLLALPDGHARLSGHERRLRRRQGDPVDVALSATLLSIGAQDYLLASFVDITYQKLAARQLAQEAELLEREVARRTAELNSLFHALPDMYFQISRASVILDVRAGNPAQLMRPAAEQIGRRIDEILPPRSAAQMQQALAECLDRQQLTTVEYSHADDGQERERTYEARLAPAGETVVAVVRDITERRALEAEREAAREQAERQARHRSEFLANMSHEIRTPLNAILGFAQIGREQARGGPSEGGYQRILDAGRLLLGIVNDVLDFSKIEAERLDVESIPAHPRQLIEATVDMIREGARAKGLALRVRLSDALPDTCLTDPLRLQQILANLLSNALKFTRDGEIGVEAGVEDERLCIDVIDTGIGMSTDQIDQLFAPFRQADASTTRRYGGTGLGLTISRRLAELMGGTLDVHSQLGRGSRFRLALPLREAAGTTLPLDLDEPAPQPGSQPLRGLRLLVAEDNEVNQLVIDQALQGAGAQVVLAGNGREAVEAVRADPQGFDVVLMDIQMPEMDGFEATRQLRRLAPQLPVIGQTAHALAAERDQCLACGMVAHVAKPLDLERLFATLVAVARRPRPVA